MTQESRPTALATLDTHVAGEPARIVLNAAELLRGETPGARREDLLTRQSWIRTGLMREPRGHRDMFGVIVVPPSDPATADVGAVYMEHDGCPMTCGHGTIGLVSAIIERGIVPGLERADTVRVEAPGAIIPVAVNRDARGGLASVVLRQPAMRVAARPVLPHPERAGETVAAALLQGPTWVLLVEETELGVAIAETATERLLELVRSLRGSVLAWLETRPSELGADASEAAQHLAGSPIGILGAPTRDDCAVRTFVGFGERSIDRSPCGTAVSALVALRASDGELAPGDWIGIEAVSGERFDAAIAEHPADGNVAAHIRGRGYITGQAEFEFDEADPFAEGFEL